jgi:hypothetical protein
MEKQVNSFVNQFVAKANGDNTTVKAEKAWRIADSALKVQLALLEGDTVGLEVNVESAQEALEAAYINGGEPVNKSTYVNVLIERKNDLTDAEKAYKKHITKLDFLKDVHSKLQA